MMKPEYIHGKRVVFEEAYEIYHTPKGNKKRRLVRAYVGSTMVAEAYTKQQAMDEAKEGIDELDSEIAEKNKYMDLNCWFCGEDLEKDKYGNWHCSDPDCDSGEGQDFNQRSD